MRRISFAPEAVQDINAIWDYLAGRSFDAADRMRDLIDREIQRIAERPGLGHRRVDLAPVALRVWAVKRYLVIYRYNDEELEVVRIVHAARNLSRFFGALEDEDEAEE